MNESNRFFVGYALVVVAFLVFLVGLVVGSNTGRSGAEYEALKAGVGRYEADPVDKTIRFVYGSAK